MDAHEFQEAQLEQLKLLSELRRDIAELRQALREPRKPWRIRLFEEYQRPLGAA